MSLVGRPNEKETDEKKIKIERNRAYLGVKVAPSESEHNDDFEWQQQKKIGYACLFLFFDFFHFYRSM